MKVEYWLRRLGYGIFACIISFAWVFLNVLIFEGGLHLHIGESAIAGIFMIPAAFMIAYAIIIIPVSTLMMLFHCLFDKK